MEIEPEEARRGRREVRENTGWVAQSGNKAVNDTSRRGGASGGCPLEEFATASMAVTSVFVASQSANGGCLRWPRTARRCRC